MPESLEVHFTLAWLLAGSAQEKQGCVPCLSQRKLTILTLPAGRLGEPQESQHLPGGLWKSRGQFHSAGLFPAQGAVSSFRAHPSPWLHTDLPPLALQWVWAERHWALSQGARLEGCSGEVE